MFKLVIFDLDGTLLDTIEDLANSTNYALQQHGFAVHSVDEYRFFVGNGVNKLIERALPPEHRNADMISMLKEDFREHYFTHSEECTKPYKGIDALLRELHGKGIKLAVASNKMHAATERLVKYFFPEIPFEIILGQRDRVPVKPHPEIVNEIVSTCNVSKAETLYVGDSGVDAATAYNANVTFAGVLWGFRPQKELEEVGATLFVSEAVDILEIVFGRNR